MATSSERTSADIQREIEADRQRIGSRIDAIQERMSPGQLVDEVLAYAKNSGGGEYVSNLGQAVKTNPLPVALVGVGLAWLMAKQGTASSPEKRAAGEEVYPLYPVNGPVKRLGPPEMSGGNRYSHFGDSSGKRLRALTDESGRRAGHFVDEAGKAYRGFADASGRTINEITDETGALLDAASGWASDTWNQIKVGAANITSRASDAADAVAQRSANAGSNLQDQAGKLNEAILHHFRDQPLVGGALAFAVGAAIGAALPPTEQENELFGEAADRAKETASDQASALLEQGKEVASDVYDAAVSVATDVHDHAKDRVMTETERLTSESTQSTSGR